MSIENKFVNGESSFFGGPNSYFKSMQIGIVVRSGIDANGNLVTIPVDMTNPVQKQYDEAFNVDPYIIRCRIPGNQYDTGETDDLKLKNCYPLLPKFGAPIPKPNEMVLVFMTGPNDNDRFYIGPITSDLTKIDNQSLLGGATENLSVGYYKDLFNPSKDENSKGIYAEYDNDNTVVINGRNNADIVFKNSEVLIRAGKFVENNPKEFNSVNPAYIQIKNNIKNNGKSISVNNIVADKINLLTYGSTETPNGNVSFNLTNRDLINNKTPYITDDELNKIIEEAHPLVFGDILLEYLKSLKEAFETHIHDNFGATPPLGPAVATFKLKAKNLEPKMLSKNIRIN